MIRKEIVEKLDMLTKENRKIFLDDMNTTFEERLDQFIKLTVK